MCAVLNLSVQKGHDGQNNAGDNVNTHENTDKPWDEPTDDGDDADNFANHAADYADNKMNDDGNHKWGWIIDIECSRKQWAKIHNKLPFKSSIIIR